ncbi:hypothetical protein E2C01_013691 [Portunus trituberculatus]|uniref:Uncharacterized protein n=1 Tax=Portunus trituberculatus TaxID=210409 RepID=A0A5B7DI48_PORTR|nr:hypothetical protein [Portunus trituberculatus]
MVTLREGGGGFREGITAWKMSSSGEADEAGMRKKLFRIMDLRGIGCGSMNVKCTDKAEDNILRVLK